MALRVDPKSVVGDFDRHRASPHISFIEHVQKSQLALADSLKGRKAIYLDTKYWVILRNAAIGATARVDGTALLLRLRDLVAAGRAFCPISESTFAELFKQTDPNTRRVTATLIDELGLGVTLVPFYDRIPLELRHLIERRLGRTDRPGPQDLIWLKASYALGLVHQSATPFDAATELVIQKAFFDYLWTTSMTAMVDHIGNSQSAHPDRFDALATRLNADTADQAHELRSFVQTYDIEAAGAADIIAPIAAHVANDIAEQATGRAMPHDGPQWNALLTFWRAFLPEALKTDEGKDILRTTHISTCLHASLRWNKGHKYEGNDFYDFHHAQAALGYCDVFLTERPLRAMLTANHVALDKRYDCEVVATIGDALAALARLGPCEK
ncbi:MAG: hypothetical protein BroJett021_52540 [Chloroflexota bacterium]|nr:MAG: hypothetical protein BroJett021_52540 [Chloroflexota bacterium]